MEDRDIFATICLIGGVLVLVVSYGRTIIQLNYSEKPPTYLWGELRSENARFTFVGWLVSAVLTCVSVVSSFILIYYYIVPFSWWLTNAAAITFFVGAFLWYDITRICFCNDIRDIAAIPILLTVIGLGIMVVALVHPDTTVNNPTNNSDKVAYRMVLVMMGLAFFHHLILDVFVWYFSFVFMKNSKEEFCGEKFQTRSDSLVGSGQLRNRGMSRIISSNRREIPGLAA